MKHEFIMPFICKWEGGKSNDKKDAASSNPCPIPYNGVYGYHTVMGVTWPVWLLYSKSKGVTVLAIQADKFFNMTKENQSDVFKVLYWDKVFGDNYTNHAIANCMASWSWGSGINGSLKQIQKFCSNNHFSIPNSWQFVPLVLNKIENSKDLFYDLCDARAAFFKSISGVGTKNAKFQKGWLNRLAAFIKFNQPLIK